MFDILSIIIWLMRVMWNLVIFFNKSLNKQLSCQWFEIPWLSCTCLCNLKIQEFNAWHVPPYWLLDCYDICTILLSLSHWLCYEETQGPVSIWRWVRSRNCGCLVTWFCYQLIAKTGNKTATVPWPDPDGLSRYRDFHYKGGETILSLWWEFLHW